MTLWGARYLILKVFKTSWFCKQLMGGTRREYTIDEKMNAVVTNLLLHYTIQPWMPS